MPTRNQERLGGALIAAGGVVTSALVWRTVTAGQPVVKLGFAAPGFAVIGLALLLIPGYRTERLARGEDIGELQGLALLTPRWKVVLGVAIAAVLVFYGVLALG